MADAMLPEAVFPPAIAVIGAGQHRGRGESGQQGPQLLIHPFQAGTLAAAALGG